MDSQGALQILYFVGAMGATLVMNVSKIARPIRNLWRDLFGCAMCFGFWAGLLTALFVVGLPIVGAVFYGLAVSLCSYFVYAVLARIGMP